MNQFAHTRHYLNQLLKNGTGILGLHRQDVWLASFPRSGNSWFRSILATIISIAELDGATPSPAEIDRIMPVLGANNLFAPWPYKVIPRFVKTHRPYYPVLFDIPQRTVLVVRDPRDVAVSYYHFSRSLRQRAYTGSFSQFIRDPKRGVSPAIDYYFSWKNRASVIVRYEALRQDTCSETMKVFDTLGIAVSEEIVQLALQKTSFENMQRLEAQYGVRNKERFTPEFKATRKGTSRQWEGVFSPEDQAYYQDVCREKGFELYV